MKKIFFVFVILGLYKNILAQNVGIGTTVPNTSAQVDITSSNKGLLIPRMGTAAIASINSPAKGLMVYDSTKNQLMVNMGTSALPNWQTIVANSGWALTGNSTTNSATHFVGTTDLQPLLLKVANQNSGYIDFNSTIANTSFGYQALVSNTTGYFNTGNGYKSLYSNTTGLRNAAGGYLTLYSNTTGVNNTAYGAFALTSNTSGSGNTAYGTNASFQNIGSFNTAIGHTALATTTNSQYNTAIGYDAGGNHDNGYNNVFVGANTDVNGQGYYNVIAIGKDAICSAPSQAVIGNRSTVTIGGYVGWTTYPSDMRYKKDIKENVMGLDFIMKLRPVTYHLNLTDLNNNLYAGRKITPDKFTQAAIKEKEQMLFSGFVAQEVEQAANATGYDFSGVDKPKNATDFYGLRYAEFVVPLVKAMQEQQEQIIGMQNKMKLLEEQNKILLKVLKNKN
jgi:trimeric autotransporter adhesin